VSPSKARGFRRAASVEHLEIERYFDPLSDRLHDMEIQALFPLSIRLQQFREDRGWSQAELSRRSKVPQSTISRIEAGEIGSISLGNLEWLPDALGVNAAVLIVHEPKGKRG
jgi:DNA-binding Xre family transcriptional regulator